jgi:hypothetical protein
MFLIHLLIVKRMFCDCASDWMTRYSSVTQKVASPGSCMVDIGTMPSCPTMRATISATSCTGNLLGRGQRSECAARQPGRDLTRPEVARLDRAPRDAVRVVREANGVVTHAITLVDREEGAEEALRDEGIVLVPLFAKSDFMDPDVE